MSEKGLTFFVQKAILSKSCGGVAQLARACGSYPQCRGFKSLLRYHYSLARWSSGQDAALSRLKQGFDSPTGHPWSIKYQYVKNMEV